MNSSFSSADGERSPCPSIAIWMSYRVASWPAMPLKSTSNWSVNSASPVSVTLFTPLASVPEASTSPCSDSSFRTSAPDWSCTTSRNRWVSSTLNFPASATPNA